MRELVSRLRWRIIAACGGPTPEIYAAISLKARALDQLQPALIRAEQLCIHAGIACSQEMAAVHVLCNMVEATFRFAHRFDNSGRCSCGEWRQ